MLQDSRSWTMYVCEAQVGYMCQQNTKTHKVHISEEYKWLSGCSVHENWEFSPTHCGGWKFIKSVRKAMRLSQSALLMKSHDHGHIKGHDCALVLWAVLVMSFFLLVKSGKSDDWETHAHAHAKFIYPSKEPPPHDSAAKKHCTHKVHGREWGVERRSPKTSYLFKPGRNRPKKTDTHNGGHRNGFQRFWETIHYWKTVEIPASDPQLSWDWHEQTNKARTAGETENIPGGTWYCHSHNHWGQVSSFPRFLVPVYYWKTVGEPETDPQILWEW